MVPHSAKLLEPAGAQHVLHHVPPERLPNGAIHRGIHSELVLTKDGSGGVLRRPGGICCPLLDHGLVDQLCVGEDDHGPRPHLEGED